MQVIRKFFWGTDDQNPFEERDSIKNCSRKSLPQAENRIGILSHLCYLNWRSCGGWPLIFLRQFTSSINQTKYYRLHHVTGDCLDLQKCHKIVYNLRIYQKILHAEQINSPWTRTSQFSVKMNFALKHEDRNIILII